MSNQIRYSGANPHRQFAAEMPMPIMPFGIQNFLQTQQELNVKQRYPKSNLVVLNEYKSTRRALIGNKKQSCPDITAATEDIAICSSWNILDNQLSDHYPLLLTVAVQTLPRCEKR